MWGVGTEKRTERNQVFTTKYDTGWASLGSEGEESARNAGDPGLIPGSGRSPGEGNGNPLQCSCLQQSMDRGVWQATVHGNHRVGHD